MEASAEYELLKLLIRYTKGITIKEALKLLEIRRQNAYTSYSTAINTNY